MIDFNICTTQVYHKWGLIKVEWDPVLYNEFKRERFLPVADLINLLNIKENISGVDLGCGTGEIAAKLVDLLPDSHVLGIDSSSDMIAEANKNTNRRLSFELKSIEAISGKWDLVFSNAAIQWVENHDKLIKKLFTLLNPGGQLLLQIPTGNIAIDLIREVAKEEPFNSLLDSWTYNSPVLTIDKYSQLLFELDSENIVVFEKVYPSTFADIDSIVSWVKGTAVLPYFERLPLDKQRDFINRYHEKIEQLFTTKPIFFPFKRIIISATSKL